MDYSLDICGLRAALAAERSRATLTDLGSVLLQHSWGEVSNTAMVREAHALLREAAELSAGDDGAPFAVMLFNLGTAQSQLALHADAAATFARYSALAPDDSDGHASRAAALQNCDRYGDAIAAYNDAVRLDPRDAQSWVQRGESQRYLEQPEAAIESFNRAIAVLEQRSLVSGGVGQSDEHDDSESSDTDEDEDAEATAALLEHARHCVAMTLAMVKETRGGALSDAPAPPSRCANGYVSGLFDRFAATFDERLVAELHYVGHELVANAARRSVRGDGELALRAARGELRVLDLGAGTGLCGKLVSDWSKSTTGKLVGVDLSPKMLALAAALGVYDELVVAEVTAWCVAHAAKSGSAAKQAHAPPAVPPAEEETQAPAAAALVVDFCRPFDIVLAADTVIYFGALGELFAAVGNLLAQNGRFIFSCEAGKSAEGEEESAADAACRDGWELQGSGRYVHSRACVLGAARRCGLVLESSESALMRIENGVEVFAEIYCVRL